MSGFNGIATCNLGADPVRKELPDGKVVITEIRVYVNAGYFNSKEEWVDKGFWANLEVRGVHSEPAFQFLRSGHKAVFSGVLSMDKWVKNEAEKKMPKIFCTMIAPYLPSVESVSFKPKKSGNSDDSEGLSENDDDRTAI